METLSPHNRITVAVGKMLTVTGFNVEYDSKRSGRGIKGDSGITYYFDLIARKGLITIIGDIGIRGKTDPQTVQILKAELDDLIEVLRRPHGMIVNPNGSLPDAEKIAKHFGILTINLSMSAAEEVIKTESQSKIKSIAESYGILF